MRERKHGESAAGNAAADHGAFARQDFDLAESEEGLFKAAFLGFDGFDAEIFDTGGIQDDSFGLDG
jgi:hypothetical protein